MNEQPQAPVTMLMAVHNGQEYLHTAVESVLNQTCPRFQFLVVDDGSTDETPQIVRSFSDPRIELVRLEKNVGQTAALNLGLRHAKTTWIARMDADDFSHPTRLEKQMQALEVEPKLRCLGTGFWEFREDPAHREKVVVRPQLHSGIRQAVLHGSGMIHGSIVVHRESLLACGAYNERYRYASDRDLFFRLVARYPVKNLTEPLVGLRRHPGQDSFTLQAADEYIEIFQKQLIQPHGYTRKELATLRKSLAYAFIFRARIHRSNQQGRRALKDLLEAFRSSPVTCGRSAGGAIAAQVLPKPVWARWVLDVGKLT